MTPPRSSFLPHQLKDSTFTVTPAAHFSSAQHFTRVRCAYAFFFAVKKPFNLRSVIDNIMHNSVDSIHNWIHFMCFFPNRKLRKYIFIWNYKLRLRIRLGL